MSARELARAVKMQEVLKEVKAEPAYFTTICGSRESGNSTKISDFFLNFNKNLA